MYIASVKSPAVNSLTVIFHMRNKRKGGAAQILSGDKQKVMHSHAHLHPRIISSASALESTVLGCASVYIQLKIFGSKRSGNIALFML